VKNKNDHGVWMSLSVHASMPSTTSHRISTFPAKKRYHCLFAGTHFLSRRVEKAELVYGILSLVAYKGDILANGHTSQH